MKGKGLTAVVTNSWVTLVHFVGILEQRFVERASPEDVGWGGGGKSVQVPEAGKHGLCLRNNKEASWPQQKEQNENAHGQGGHGE